LRRLRAFDGQDQFSQALFDHFCSDLDANLREMGVGDLTVPKRMVAFGEAFYGRSKAYDAAIEPGANRLAEALAKNVMSTTDPDRARALAVYVTSAIERLELIELPELRGGLWQFASPSAAPASA
jgi:cytochrome b pre-mRNA-processing protein 3